MKAIRVTRLSSKQLARLQQLGYLVLLATPHSKRK